jgi:uncharacterized Zn finger protein
MSRARLVMTGRLSDFHLADVLQAVGLSRQYTAIELRRTEGFDGTIWVKNGRVIAAERDRAPYVVRLWMREEGLAYECTCPVGVTRQFCKHTVAIALAHLENERKEAERGLGILREALMTVQQPALVERLLVLARRDQNWSDELKRLALDALSSQ